MPLKKRLVYFRYIGRILLCYIAFFSEGIQVYVYLFVTVEVLWYERLPGLEGTGYEVPQPSFFMLLR